MSNWTHKVVKSQRGADGKWFYYPSTSRFNTEEGALHYAKQFAAEQAGVPGTRILVLSRKSFAGEFGRTNCVAEFKVADFAAPA